MVPDPCGDLMVMPKTVAKDEVSCSVPTPPKVTPDKVCAVARKFADQPIQEMEPDVWAILTAISKKARLWPQKRKTKVQVQVQQQPVAATVAVKVFNIQQSGSSKSFEAECETLRRVRHRCLLKIVTYCSSVGPQGEEFKALVFEFMANGSLDDWIHPRSSNPTAENTLSLSERLGIAANIFDVLDYLHNHSHPSIVHSDLKPSNVLLADDMSAKIGDFGISRILPLGTVGKAMQNSESSIGIRGSIGYIALEIKLIDLTGNLFS
eukprot:XP_008671474.1 probable LRR receptor-like serine/threonine-protein kinase At3g47570 [Zea mays]